MLTGANSMNPIMIPPLRLILNTTCNGHCSYCHKEGYAGTLAMPTYIIDEAINAAKELALPCISLTGGEPTLRSDLPEIVSKIIDIYPNVKIHLTTNGHSLIKYIDTKVSNIDTLNLSMTSFDNQIASKYQNVEPKEAISAFNKIKVKNKNLNIVIVEDNYMEIDSIIKYCLHEEISLDLMFELNLNTQSTIHKYVFDILNNYAIPHIQLKATPSLIYNISNKCKIRIKHPILSKLLNRNICSSCNSNHMCFERVCAVRVHPDGLVTPCLNKSIISNEKTTSKQIKDIYSMINEDGIYELLLK